MIYLDNGATTFPKPPGVSNAVNQAIKEYGANPGRGGHKLSLRASEEIYNCRTKAAKFFNAENEENVIFTSNCTHGINTIIKGYLGKGDHVVISNMEHNSVTRPLTALKERGVTFTEATVFPGDNDETLNSFRNAINPRTKLVICTHASNVFGVRLPIERITALSHQYGIKVLVDGAQSAGVLPIDIKNSAIDFFATAGHKGLYGPMGTGILIISNDDGVATLMEGGTGSGSASYVQPQIVPDRFESGTPNLPGIAGLSKGFDFLNKTKIENIAAHEMSLIQRLYKKLAIMDHITLYTDTPDILYSVPVLSFNVVGKDSEDVAAYLDKNYGIAVRAGLHCAPSAHIAMNTIETGTVRISPSYFNSTNHIDTLIAALHKIKLADL